MIFQGTAMVDILPQESMTIDVLRAASARACPKCRSAKRTRRIARSLWMRLFPNSVNMACGQCGHRFWRIS
jgi:hypothetical protein